MIVGATLGCGSFGSVHQLSAPPAAGGADLAVKRFFGAEVVAPSSALRELSFMHLLTACDAPNTVPLVGVLLEWAGRPSLAAVMPRYDSDLALAIERRAVGEPAFVFRDVLLALSFLHGAEPAIAHADLRAENVLLEGPVGAPSRALLSDFGQAAFVDEMRASTFGRPGYNAPESGRPGVWLPGLDLWASGVLWLELLSLRRLRARTDRGALRYLRAERARRAADEDGDLFARLTAEPACKREGAAQALLHSVFSRLLPSPAHPEPPRFALARVEASSRAVFFSEVLSATHKRTHALLLAGQLFGGLGEDALIGLADAEAYARFQRRALRQFHGGFFEVTAPT